MEHITMLFLANVNVLHYVCYMLWAVRLSVCLSVCCLWRWCTLLRRLDFSAIFFHHTIAQGLYFSGAKNRWWGTPLSPWNLRSKWPNPLKQRNFDQYRLIAPQPWYLAKKVQLALIGSRPRAFQRAIDEPCTLPLSPQRVAQKRDIAVCASKIQVLSNKVCYKVSLYENFQRQSCCYIIPLSNGP